MDKTIPTDTDRPKIIFRKSFPIKGKTYRSLYSLFIVAIASSLPHNKPTNTHVVDIGKSFNSLKMYSIQAYITLIIVAERT